jgi:hypothetical protein
VYAGISFIDLNMDKASLDSRITQVADYGWMFQWGMFIFLMAALGIAAWIFIDSTQKRKADKALAPRIAALVGVFFVIPTFIFRFTNTTDAVTNTVRLLGEPSAPLYDQAIPWNVEWLAAGQGPKIALLAMLGVFICIFAAIYYASTVSRQRPSTEFVSALNNQFGELRQEIQSVKSRQPMGTSADTVAPGMSSAGQTMATGSPAARPSAATIMGGPGQAGANATIIDRGGASRTKVFGELRVVSGGRVGQRWELPSTDIKIGRDATNLVSLDDGKISREHSKIRFVDGAFHIIDLGSSNGTYVNDVQIGGQTQLNDGDLVRVGDTVMAFKAVQAL